MGFDFLDDILASPVVITAGIVWAIALVVSAAIFFIGSALLGFLIPNAYVGWIALGLGMYISSWISLLDNNDWVLVLASAVSTILFSAVFILLMGAIFPDSFVLGDIFGLSPILAFAVLFLIILLFNYLFFNFFNDEMGKFNKYLPEDRDAHKFEYLDGTTMSFAEIIYDGVRFPFWNIRLFLFMGMVSLFMADTFFKALAFVTSNLNADNFLIYTIFPQLPYSPEVMISIQMVFMIFFALCLFGYGANIIRRTVYFSKVFILPLKEAAMFGVRPMIISCVMLCITVIAAMLLLGIGDADYYLSDYVRSAVLVVLFLVSITLLSVFLARFADYRELRMSLNPMGIWNDLVRMWWRIAILSLAGAVFLRVSLAVMVWVSAVPFAWEILLCLVCGFLLMFYYRVLGLIYRFG